MNRIDFYATDETIQRLMSRYGVALEQLGSQRFQLLQVLAHESLEMVSPDVESVCLDIAQELSYLDSRARAGVIAAIAHRLWEES